MSKFALLLFMASSAFVGLARPSYSSNIGTDFGAVGDKDLTSDPNYEFLVALEAEAGEKGKENLPRETWSDVLAELRHGLSLEEREGMAATRRSVDSLPDTFDARDKWKKCKRLIGTIYDQGPCISDYAIIAASVVADRLCIKNPKFRTLLSAQKVLGCYGSCKGGYIFPAFDYVNKTGVPTGGLYSPKRGCIPFEPKPCSHGGAWADKDDIPVLETGVSLPNCSSLNPEDYTCPSKCTNSKYKKKMDDDLHTTSHIAWTSTNETQIREDIYNNGPVAAAFSMYSDFYKYKSGVYSKSREAKYEYIHKVKLIGWGTENGTNYWLAVNTFNKNWGKNGLFKYPRGSNYCFIETLVVTATVKN